MCLGGITEEVRIESAIHVRAGLGHLVERLRSGPGPFERGRRARLDRARRLAQAGGNRRRVDREPASEVRVEVNAHLGCVVLHQDERPVGPQAGQVATARVEGFERLRQIRLPAPQRLQGQPGQDARGASVVAVEERERIKVLAHHREGAAGQRLRIVGERRELDPPSIGRFVWILDPCEIHPGRPKW